MTKPIVTEYIWEFDILLTATSKLSSFCPIISMETSKIVNSAPNCLAYISKPFKKAAILGVLNLAGIAISNVCSLTFPQPESPSVSMLLTEYT